MHRPAQAVTLAQAADQSVTLAQLARLAAESTLRLRAVESLIPVLLRPAIQAGPIEGDTWCLLVSGNAAAAKLRQLLPLIQAALADRGWKITSIRVKVQLPGRA
jgi:hypothetical protein